MVGDSELCAAGYVGGDRQSCCRPRPVRFRFARPGCGERAEHDLLEGCGVLGEANHPALAAGALRWVATRRPEAEITSKPASPSCQRTLTSVPKCRIKPTGPTDPHLPPLPARYPQSTPIGNLVLGVEPGLHCGLTASYVPPHAEVPFPRVAPHIISFLTASYVVLVLLLWSDHGFDHQADCV